MTMTNNSLGSAVGSVGAMGGSVTVTPTGNVHPAGGHGPPLQIPMSVAASLMASVSSKSNLPQQPQPPQQPHAELQAAHLPSVTVSLASTPHVGKEEVISAGNSLVPQPQVQHSSVIVTPTVVPVVNNGNGMKSIETMNKVEVTPILEENNGVSGPKKAKLD